MTEPPDSLTEIVVPGDRLIAEGIAVAKGGTVHGGSLSDGRILELPPGESEPREWVPTGSGDRRAIGSAVGLRLDASLDPLWVCDGGGPAAPRPSAILGISRESRVVSSRHPLPGGAGLCNDLMQDAESDLYATDSLRPRMFGSQPKTDKATTRRRDG